MADWKLQGVGLPCSPGFWGFPLLASKCLNSLYFHLLIHYSARKLAPCKLPTGTSNCLHSRPRHTIRAAPDIQAGGHFQGAQVYNGDVIVSGAGHKSPVCDRVHQNARSTPSHGNTFDFLAGSRIKNKNLPRPQAGNEDVLGYAPLQDTRPEIREDVQRYTQAQTS